MQNAPSAHQSSTNNNVPVGSSAPLSARVSMPGETVTLVSNGQASGGATLTTSLSPSTSTPSPAPTAIAAASAVSSPLRPKKGRWQWWQKIVLIVLAGLLVAFLGWWLIFPEESSLFFKTATDANNRAVEVPSTATPMLELTDNLKVAKAILDQFTAHQSSEGFYGDYQICESEGQNCQPLTWQYEDDESPATASYRYDIPVIWARFKYYQATHDQEQLTLMKQDLVNLVSQILDSQERVLQTDSYNCAMMKEITSSNLVDAETKNLASRVCLEASFEYFPNSDIAIDQHNHDLLVIYMEGKPNYDHLPIIPVPGEKPDSEDLVTFDKKTVAENINENLNSLLRGERQKYGGVKALYQEKFMKRELLSAIDQWFASDLAKMRNEASLSARAELDSLLLTRETLAWFNNNPATFADIDICLLKNNLSLLIGNEVIDLEQNSNFENILNHGDLTAVDNVVCSYSDYLVGGMSAVKQNDLMEQVFENDVLTGYFYARANQEIIYPTEINAILAGLLSL